MLSYLVYYQTLEFLAIEIASLTGASPSLEQSATNIIVKLPSFSFLANESPTAMATLGRATQQIAAGRMPGIKLSWCPMPELILNFIKSLPINNGWPGVFHSNWLQIPLACSPPDKGTGVCLLDHFLYNPSSSEPNYN